jgi:hypothetical protein
VARSLRAIDTHATPRKKAGFAPAFLLEALRLRWPRLGGGEIPDFREGSSFDPTHKLSAGRTRPAKINFAKNFIRPRNFRD